jgi:Ni/Co efflux regulator RcnB
MKFFLTALLLSTVPALALAQTAAPAKPAPKATAKATPKAAAKPATKAKSSPAAVRRSALKAVEEVTPIDDDLSIKLSAEDLELAKRVYVGSIPCELGSSVTLVADEKRPGFFTVSTKGNRFRMHPVESRTGAIRLEDPKAGAMWLQLGNKSMLMSQKLGQRLADECMSPAQITFADGMKKNPAPSILDAAPTAPATPDVATSK